MITAGRGDPAIDLPTRPGRSDRVDTTCLSDLPFSDEVVRAMLPGCGPKPRFPVMDNGIRGYMGAHGTEDE